MLLGMVGGNLSAEEIGPELKTVADALQPIFEKLESKVEIVPSSQGKSLSFAYQAQIFKIHGRQMTGEVQPNAHDELGPNFKGFVLKVHLQDKGEVNQAVTPQTLKEPYWQTYLDVTPLAGTQNQIYWALSYGVRTDEGLLTKIKQVLANLKEAAK